MFMAQRACMFHDWWAKKIGVETRQAILRDCGVPSEKTPFRERFKGFPERFTVEELTTPADIDEPDTAQPPIYAERPPFDGATRTPAPARFRLSSTGAEGWPPAFAEITSTSVEGRPPAFAGIDGRASRGSPAGSPSWPTR